MNFTKENIKEINKIINIAMEKTPVHINGLIIPSRYESQFFYLIDFFIRKAKDADKYWKQICDMRVKLEQETHKFMATFIKSVSDGIVNFNMKKEEIKEC